MTELDDEFPFNKYFLMDMGWFFLTILCCDIAHTTKFISWVYTIFQIAKFKVVSFMEEFLRVASGSTLLTSVGFWSRQMLKARSIIFKKIAVRIELELGIYKGSRLLADI